MIVHGRACSIHLSHLDFEAFSRGKLRPNPRALHDTAQQTVTLIISVNDYTVYRDVQVVRERWRRHPGPVGSRPLRASVICQESQEIARWGPYLFQLLAGVDQLAIMRKW